ncbi:hypothetical protein BDZ91DRAFT_742459, partial [Kalaharituber pfeilii]
SSPTEHSEGPRMPRRRTQSRHFVAPTRRFPSNSSDIFLLHHLHDPHPQIPLHSSTHLQCALLLSAYQSSQRAFLTVSELGSFK